MLNLIRYYDILSTFNLNHVANIQELDTFNFGLCCVKLNKDVLNSQITVHGSSIGHVLEEMASNLDDLCQDFQAMLFLQSIVKTRVVHCV